LAADVRAFWGLTLYHPDDLPWAHFAPQKRKQARAPPPLAAASSNAGDARFNADAAFFSALPDVMTTFSKVVDAHAMVRLPSALAADVAYGVTLWLRRCGCACRGPVTSRLHRLASSAR